MSQTKLILCWHENPSLKISINKITIHLHNTWIIHQKVAEVLRASSQAQLDLVCWYFNSNVAPRPAMLQTTGSKHITTLCCGLISSSCFDIRYLDVTAALSHLFQHGHHHHSWKMFVECNPVDEVQSVMWSKPVQPEYPGVDSLCLV